MLTNFIEKDVNPKDIHIVCWKVNGVISIEWENLRKKYKEVSFFFYDDLRTTKNYISSIRPNILKQHFAAHPELKFQTIFYHDCDIIFTKSIKEWITEEMITDENWYGSDTRWYIAHSYVKSKGEEVLKDMCSIVGISPEVVEQNELNSIGAQYIMKDIDEHFWNKVEKDSERLFIEINNKRPIYEKTWENKILEDSSVTRNDKGELIKNGQVIKYHELQIWCADMWAVLWNGWLRGKNTIADKRLEFSWATSNLEVYNRCNIMHNAGVVGPQEGLFFKGTFINRLPYDENLEIKDNTASKEYWKLIKKVGETSCIK